MFKQMLGCAILLGCVRASAEIENKWSNETEASIVQVGGNTESESYSAKQKVGYTFDVNSIVLAGRYLQTKAGSTETARNWEASLRYERALSEKWAAFVQHGAESNSYAGFTQRDNTDLGGKYFFIKSDEENFFTEAGARSSRTLSSTSSDVKSSTSGRLYVEYSKKITESTTGKFWVEYLPNFTTSDAWLLNYEPSLSVMLSQVFSLKASYLVKYHNAKVLPSEKKEDTTFTTSIVAKF